MTELDLYLQHRANRPNQYFLLLRTYGESYTILMEECDTIRRLIDKGTLDKEHFTDNSREYGYHRMEFGKHYIDKVIPALIHEGLHTVFKTVSYDGDITLPRKRKKPIQLELQF